MARLVKPESEIARQTTCWAGLPESSFGGSVRWRDFPGTLQFQQVDYTFPAQGNEATGLPHSRNGGMAALSSEADGTVGDLVESKLVSTASGRLSGTFMHRLPGPLTDWFLAYAGRVYRLPADGDRGGQAR